MTRLVELSVQCPRCGARPMTPCQSRKGRRLDWGRVHDERLDLVGITSPAVRKRKRAR